MESITKNLGFVRANTVDNLKSTFISNSDTHGFGLFASESILKGSILGLLDGQKLKIEHWESIRKNIAHDIKKYENYFFMECNYLENNIMLVRPLRTKYSYINHSRNPNLIINKSSMSIVALIDIEKNEELLLDYRCEPLPDDYLNNINGRYL